MNGFEGAFTVGKITEEQRVDVVRHACPGPGACGGMYTYVNFYLFIPFSHIRLVECTIRLRSTKCQYYEYRFGSALPFLALLLQYPGNLRRYV